MQQNETKSREPAYDQLFGIDRILHLAYHATAIWREEEDVWCGRCGGELYVYYAEDGLYAVKCPACGNLVLTKATNPQEAARLCGVECVGESES